MRVWVAVLALLAAGVVQAAPVRVDHPAPLRPGMEALPRIVSPATPATRKINADLAAMDKSNRDFIKTCLESFPDFPPVLRTKVTPTMLGPRYFTLVIDSSNNCDTGLVREYNGLTYDLATGAPVFWASLAPASMQADLGGGPEGHALREAYLPVQRARVAKDPRTYHDCDAILAGRLDFDVWPDARTGQVIVLAKPPEYEQYYCADEVAFSTTQMRALGLDAGFLDALDAAHAAWK